ncbi:MAG TPA: hypothetical protein VFP65_05195 [Anaeromyxobacteraceae bacterium]|nr:hypothetical protein [Anaeromyxobacteraceae bacterium]
MLEYCGPTNSTTGVSDPAEYNGGWCLMLPTPPPGNILGGLPEVAVRRTRNGRSGHVELDLAPGELRDLEVVLEPGQAMESASWMREAGPPSWPRP